MAINIRIGTAFDGRGLGIAKRELATLSSSVNSLRGNLLVAGAVIAGAFTLIGKSLGDAADSQRVFAQTEAVLRSTGTTANGTAQEIAALASSLQKSTSFSDEAILSGANLLLTFKNIQNQAGVGNDIFDQTTQAMLDVARAMGTDASTEAIRLGKALNDPVAGISALTRVGIQFTEQQKEQITALAESGDLMGAQKIILAELQSQFGGSAAAYAETFAGQVEGLNNELNDLSEEIGFAVMPAVLGLITEFRELIPVIGPQIKAAIDSVDWKGLVTTIATLATFLITNAEAITFVVTAFFALNTIIKLVNIAIALKAAAMAIATTVMGLFTTATGTATVAVTTFSTALRRTGIGIIILAFGAAAAAAWEMSEGMNQGTVEAEDYTEQLSMTADQMERLANLQNSLADFEIPEIPDFSGGGSAGGVSDAIREAERVAAQAAAAAARAAEEARRAEEERLEKRRAAYESFADSVKRTFGQIKESILSSFDLPKLGGSVNSITRNIAKLLDKTKGFAKSITQLSGLGLNTALLQQVIQAGPMAGSQLASAIVGGGSAFISQLNSAYGEFGNLASGIAGVGTDRAFANQEVVNNYYQIEVSGGVGSGPSIGKAIVDAIKSYERTSGAVWQGA
jgi:hypothetical protein